MESGFCLNFRHQFVLAHHHKFCDSAVEVLTLRDPTKHLGCQLLRRTLELHERDWCTGSPRQTEQNIELVLHSGLNHLLVCVNL